MIKKMFVAAAAIGLAMNLISDIGIWHQTHETIRTGEYLNKSYDIIQQIDLAKEGLLRAKHKEPLGFDLTEKLKDLSLRFKEIPSQENLALQLLKLNSSGFSLKNEPASVALLDKMDLSERALLAQRTNANEAANNQALRKTFFSNVVDIFLIFLFVSFFFYERMKSQRLQNAIAKALVHVKEANQNLHLTLANRDSKLKTVVHDLKNPLGSIRGFAELLHDDADKKDSVIEMAQVIQRVSNRTLAMVSSALHENSDLQSLEQVNLSDSLEEVCLCLKPIAESKNQRLELKLNSTTKMITLGNRQQLQDVFFNVLGNALKFSPKGSIIKVHGQNLNGCPVVEIKDEGPGFSKTDFGKLFVAEAKLSARPTGNEESNGIGLYSVKQTMSQLNGHIEIKNNPGKGACVILQFAAFAKPRQADLTI